MGKCHKLTAEETIRLIVEHGMMVRPSILTFGWIAGKLKGSTMDGKAYIEPETRVEAKTLEEAVSLAAQKIQHVESLQTQIPQEILELAARVELSDAETLKQFEQWKMEDGTISGLQALHLKWRI